MSMSVVCVENVLINVRRKQYHINSKEKIIVRNYEQL